MTRKGEHGTVAEQAAQSEFGDEFTRFLGYESVRSTETTASSWVPLRPDLLGADGALLPVVLAFLMDSTPGVVCGATALPDWVITTDLHMQVADRRVRGTLRADATLIHANRLGVLAEVTVVDEGDADRVVATGSVNHARVPLNEPLNVPVMPVGVRTRGPAGAPAPGDRLAREIVFTQLDAAGEAATVQTPLTTNPLGIMHGSVTTALSIAAAACCAPDGWQVAEAMVRFGSSVRKGPARAAATLVHADDAGCLVRVDLRDQSYPDKTAVHSVVRLAPPRLAALFYSPTSWPRSEPKPRRGR
jgi:acyl-coenzyme A thioesterase PaaI-like protein